MIFSDSRDPVFNSRDPNRIPKTPKRKPWFKHKWTHVWIKRSISIKSKLIQLSINAHGNTGDKTERYRNYTDQNPLATVAQATTGLPGPDVPKLPNRLPKMPNSFKTCWTNWNRPMAVAFELFRWSVAKMQCCHGAKPRIITYKLTNICSCPDVPTLL